MRRLSGDNTTFDLKRYFVWKPENRVNPYECLDRFEPAE